MQLPTWTSHRVFNKTCKTHVFSMFSSWPADSVALKSSGNFVYLSFDQSPSSPQPRMTKKTKYEVRKQHCYCKDCKGASLPWSTWTRHRKALAEQLAVLGREASLIAEPPNLPPEGELDVPELEREFSQIMSKKSQRAAHIRARLLTIRDDLHRLRDRCNKLADHVTFLRPPVAEHPPNHIDVSLGAFMITRTRFNLMHFFYLSYRLHSSP